jgi:hypothetical protein
MEHTDIKLGMNVVYIPRHLLLGLRNEQIKEENIGVVTSINESYIFVKFKKSNYPNAVNTRDLYSLSNRPDLI